MNSFKRISIFVILCVAGEVWASRTWRFVVVPDTQIYMKSDEELKVLEKTFKWIREKKAELNIQAVFQVGDIVDDNSETQWRRAQRAFRILEGQVPFFFTTGNHDYGEKGLAEKRITKFPEYFKLDQTQNLGTYRSSFENGQIQNSVYELKFGEEHFLIFTLEFAPRDEVLKWASVIAKSSKAKKHILVTHEYMDMTSAFTSKDGRPYPSLKDTYGNAYHYPLQGSTKNNGSQIWQKLLFPNKKFEWVFSGHYDYVSRFVRGQPVYDEGRAFSYRKDAQFQNFPIHQMMYNAQWVPNGGDGWILIIEVDSQLAQEAKVREYSPWLFELGGTPSSKSPQSILDFKILRTP